MTVEGARTHRWHHEPVRIKWLLVGVVVVVAGAFLLGIASQDVDSVGGEGRPKPGVDANLAYLTRCVRESQDLRDLDLAGVTVGPLVEDDSGKRIFGLTRDRTFIDCGENGGTGHSPLSIPPPEEKARFAGKSYTQDATVIVGYGQVARDVARLEAVLPDGKVVRAKIAGGLFAFVADGTDPGVDAVLRAYDESGEMIFESKPG
jgi:hypothetical protein